MSSFSEGWVLHLLHPQQSLMCCGSCRLEEYRVCDVQCDLCDMQCVLFQTWHPAPGPCCSIREWSSRARGGNPGIRWWWARGSKWLLQRWALACLRCRICNAIKESPPLPEENENKLLLTLIRALWNCMITFFKPTWNREGDLQVFLCYQSRFE